IEMIRSLDPDNQYANEKREAIRKRLLQLAQSETARGALGSAKEFYRQLLEYFPSDEEANAGAKRLDAVLASKRGEVNDLAQKAEGALRAGHLVEPYRLSAFYYLREVLARDPQNAQALATRTQIKERMVATANQYQARGDSEAESKQL